MVEVQSRFSNYVESPTSVAPRIWQVARVVVLAGLLSLVVGGALLPAKTLALFWGVLVPTLPAVWMLAPGLWRNVCPLATTNQIPRVFGFSAGRNVPPFITRFGYTIGATAFATLVLTRKVVFNTSGSSVSWLLAIVVACAFTGGLIFKGKSGWCSSICPLLPIQRLYGQAPVRRVANAHCESCVGCTKNCFDFNPGVAYIADIYDDDPQFVGPRKLFAGAFPGLVLAFFRVGSMDEMGAVGLYSRSVVWILGGIALLHLAESYLPIRPNTLQPVFGAAGFAMFYWYVLPGMADALTELVGGQWTWLIWPGRILAAITAAFFVRRAAQAENEYISETSVSLTTRAAVPDSVTSGDLGEAVVKILDGGPTLEAPGNPTLLELCEGADLAIDSGCRMGVCGADPIAVVSGSAALTPPLPAELKTLARLGLGLPNRLACMARVVGEVSVSLKPDADALPEPEVATFEPDLAVERVVVIGNGIAGITAADHVRRNHPGCSIDVIGREAFHLYNRMGISKLIYNPLGVSGLNLLPEEWYERNEVTSWLNTSVRSIDRTDKSLSLATGEKLDYDRLILATGSQAMIPKIDGYGVEGCFSVRSGEHAVKIRAFVQDNHARTAFVAGGGLLGLEAAYSLHRLGVSVTIGERSGRLLRRQVDERASEILVAFFTKAGITVMHNVEVAGVRAADGAVSTLELRDGSTLMTDMLVVAAGITPSIELADAAGLDVGRGVLVDETLRTSDPAIFAVGDAAEYNGHLWGLWAVAVAQAEIAARNAVGADERYSDDVPTTVLKGAGIDVVAFGSVNAEAGDEVLIGIDMPSPPVYEKVVKRNGQVIGGVFINSGEKAVAAQSEYVEYLAAQKVRIEQ